MTDQIIAQALPVADNAPHRELHFADGSTLTGRRTTEIDTNGWFMLRCVAASGRWGLTKIPTPVAINSAAIAYISER